jgi:hypothetical protein
VFVAGTEVAFPVPELDATLVLTAAPLPVDTPSDCVPVAVATASSVLVDAFAVAIPVAGEDLVEAVEAVLLFVVDMVRT